jgi:hypothetical protein
MIHSRPGFASRRSDTAPAKLNQDMIPALHRKQKPESTTLRQIEKTPREIAADLAYAQNLAEARAAAERAGPEILVNPLASDPPVVKEPGK